MGPPPGGSRAPYNPFARTLATTEAAFRLSDQDDEQGDANSDAQGYRGNNGRAQLDVDAFKNILLTGSATGTHGSGASWTNAASTSTAYGSSTGSNPLSSGKRSSLFDSPFNIQPQSPRSSFDDEHSDAHDDDFENERIMLMGPVASRPEELAPKAPPKPKAKGPQTVSFADFDQAIPPDFHVPGRHTLPRNVQLHGILRPTITRSRSDLNKPLPLPPTDAAAATRSSEEEDSDESQEEEPEKEEEVATPKASREEFISPSAASVALGVSAAPSSPSPSTAESASAAQEVVAAQKKKTPPPPPPAARRQPGSERPKSTIMPTIVPDMKVMPESDKPDAATSKVTPPPPPPSRKTPTIALPIESTTSTISPAASLQPAVNANGERVPMPPPPPRRQLSRSGSSISKISNEFFSSPSQIRTEFPTISSASWSGSASLQAPPPPPPRRGAGSSSAGSKRNSGEHSLRRTSVESDRSAQAALPSVAEPLSLVTSPSQGGDPDQNQKTILEDMSAFQAEIDALVAAAAVQTARSVTDG